MILKFEEFCCSEIERMVDLYCGPIGHTKGRGFSFAARPISFCPFCGKHFDDIILGQLYTTTFCCDGMACDTKACDPSDEFDIYYQSFTRRYYFAKCREWKAFEMGFGFDEVYQEWDFQYCIHCGTKLPESLEKEWTKIILEKFGVTADLKSDESVAETLKQLPEEFRTDAWWKNRGL